MGEIKKVNLNILESLSDVVSPKKNYSKYTSTPIEHIENDNIITTLMKFQENNTKNDIKSSYYNNIKSSANNSIITVDWTNNMIKQLQEKNINLSDYSISLDEVPLILIYLKNIEDTPMYSNLSLEEKLVVAKIIQKDDTNLEIAHKTPMLMHGKVNTKINHANPDKSSEKFEYEGDYLQFYNEYGVQVIAPISEIVVDTNGIVNLGNAFPSKYRQRYIETMTKYYSDVMNNSEKYSEKFKNQTMNNLKTICLANIFNKENLDTSGAAGANWAAYVTTNEEEKLKTSSNMVIDTNAIMDVGQPEYNYMVDSFTHELGHVFANASNIGHENDIDKELPWKTVYNQLSQYGNDQTGPLREYALESPSEAFAECVAEYYGGNSGQYNPNDLKTVEIDLFGIKASLHDIMSSILE